MGSNDLKKIYENMVSVADELEKKRLAREAARRASGETSEQEEDHREMISK